MIGRKVIDFWFKLATRLLSGVLIFAAAVISFIGWKTIADAKASATGAAQEAAKAKVEEILQQGEIRQLVERTAQDLIAKGEFQKVTADAVRAQLPGVVATELRKQVPTELTTELARMDLLPRTTARSRRRSLRPFRNNSEDSPVDMSPYSTPRGLSRKRLLSQSRGRSTKQVSAPPAKNG